jgi:hypothetical protein
MIICKKCGSIANYNSYFDAYICGHCHTKNYPSVERTNSNYEEKKSMYMGILDFFKGMIDRKNRLSRQH